MISSVVISAAGRGTRMKELTRDRPKHLIAVNGKPFLSYVLERLLAAGFERLFLVVGYRKEHFADFLEQFPHPVTVIDQHERAGDAYGTAIPLRCVRTELEGEQFISVAGDNLYDMEDLRAMRQLEDAYTYIGGLEVPHPDGKGILLADEDGFLTRIVEKPKEFVGTTINTSLYKLTPDIFPALERVGVSERGEYEITDALTMLAAERKVKVVRLRASWADFGKPEDVEKMEKMFTGA